MSSKMSTTKFHCLPNVNKNEFLKVSGRPENLKKSRQKKLVKSNKSKKFFREIAFLAVLNFFPSSKIDFWPFLKLQKMAFGQNKFSWNWFIWFHDLFYFIFSWNCIEINIFFNRVVARKQKLLLRLNLRTIRLRDAFAIFYMTMVTWYAVISACKFSILYIWNQ